MLSSMTIRFIMDSEDVNEVKTCIHMYLTGKNTRETFKDLPQSPSGAISSTISLFAVLTVFFRAHLV